MKVYIFGGGTMGTAIARGLRVNGFEIVIVERNKNLELENEGFEVEVYGSNYDIKGKNIILAFKPYALESVSKILINEAKVCISVLARTPLETLKKSIKSQTHAVCLPNIAAKFCSSITPFICDKQENLVSEILDGFGKSVRVMSQAELDAGSVLAGCAPAFLAIVAEALANAGVKEGLKNSDAKNLVSGLFNGFSKLLENSHPSLIKEAVCSPGGTTIAGVAQLEKLGLRGLFFEAVRASCEKQRS